VGKTLTIIAESPPGLLEDDEIAAVVAVLEPRPDHEIARAQHLRGLCDVLDEARPRGPYDLIQLIGHGMAGVLWLGGFWWSPPRLTEAGLALAVYAHPDVLFRMGQALPPTRELRLIGCAIGAAKPAPFASPHDGPVLLHGLMRATGVAVSAPVCSIAAHVLFRPDGAFLGEDCLTTYFPDGRVRRGHGQHG